jgi:hypothetical protein
LADGWDGHIKLWSVPLAHGTRCAHVLQSLTLHKGGWVDEARGVGDPSPAARRSWRDWLDLARTALRPDQPDGSRGPTVTLTVTVVALTLTAVLAWRLADRASVESTTAPRPSVLPNELPPVSVPPAETPLVAAAGDIACDPDNSFFGRVPPLQANCHDGAVAELIARNHVHAVLALGDNQYEGATLDQFRRSYAHTWGRFKQITYPVPGNHEYDTLGAAGYFAYFGGRAGDRDKGYYSFDIGAWHVVALNSNCNAVACSKRSEQARWLRDDLAEHDNVCTLAFWHDPLHSSGPENHNRQVAPLWDALGDAGAEIVLNGHDHNYERFAPRDRAGRLDADALRQFVVGTGGNSVQGFARVDAASEVRIGETFGVLLLELHPRAYEWRFVGENGATLDAGSAPCHA